MGKRKYFGTDGIRGRVGEAPISADFALRLGRAVGRVLATTPSRTVVIGKDTRISGYMFESALEAGLIAAGANVKLLGPMPTPAVAYLTRTMRSGGGIVISASHNPSEDNGFKFFDARGGKLSDEMEEAIEAAIEEPFDTVPNSELGKASRVDDAVGRYVEFCKSTVADDFWLNGLKVVVDCAHGATYQVGPKTLKELGAQVTAIGTGPDGLNINADCGSTQLKALQDAVVTHAADLGIAFDGDGDRMLMVDHRGEIVDGDELLFIIARHRRQAFGCERGVVGTLMSNFGLQEALDGLGIEFVRAAVGDRYVLRELHERDWVLGGESSGHLICLDKTTTGDGVISALAVLEAMVSEDVPLAELKAGMRKYPQIMINVPIAGPIDLDHAPRIQASLEETERALEGSGRVILRPSGTEPVVRVTVEGKDVEQVQQLATRLAGVVEEESRA